MKYTNHIPNIYTRYTSLTSVLKHSWYISQPNQLTITYHHETKTHYFLWNQNSLIHISTPQFGIRPKPPHKYFSHKWSHTETIRPAQSQFSHPHILTFHLLCSYTPVSACPYHNSFFSHVTTTGTIHPAQFQSSQSVRLSTRLSPTISHIPYQHFHHFLYT